MDLKPLFQLDITNERPETADAEERAVDLVAPDRTQTSTSRIIRNTEVVDALKEQYNYSCQMCGEKWYSGEHIGYAEGHHLPPLGRPHNGLDTKSNILCPNCHADFDYGMLTIDPESLRIHYRYDAAIDGAQLDVADAHNPDMQFIDYHNQEIADA